MMLLIGVPAVILDAVTGTGEGEAVALPSRTVVLGWQTSFDVAPSVIDMALQVAMDITGPWTEIDSSTVVGGEFRTIQNVVAARFVRVDVDTNTGNRAVTVKVIAKVAAP